MVIIFHYLSIQYHKSSSYSNATSISYEKKHILVNLDFPAVFSISCKSTQHTSSATGQKSN